MVVVSIMIKICKFHSGVRCYRSSYDVFDCSTGSIGVCNLHSNPSGRFLPHFPRCHFVGVFDRVRRR